MEEQAEQHISKDDPDSCSTAVLPSTSSPDATVSRSVPTLRFPRPQGSQVVANWISSSSPDIMASPNPFDRDSPLSESTFEFIPSSSAEDASQDERADSMSESLSSECERYPHPDEVQAFSALDDMSNSTASIMTTDSESDGEDHANEDEAELMPDRTADPRSEDASAKEGSTRQSQQFFSPFGLADPDEILHNSLSQSSLSRSFPRTGSPSLPARSIEFSEPDDVDVHIDKISVKHTVKEFTEEQAAEFFERVGLGEAPTRVSATIRQTMSQKCLSTHEALRVLYIGDEALKGEIILKISRAITCSSSVDYNENKALRRNTEGVYNIVPVTFGAANDRDVELMEASGFQIKVDTCLDAEKIPINSRYFRNDIIYALTVDGENSGQRYKSVPAGGPEGARVQPSWALPHVAIFYCSEDDDEELQRVQRTAWEFCRRHAIPTLFISDHPAFDSAIASRWMNFTDEHVVCLSLESRGWCTEHRFPIDLTSFLNIDNRQMNQNLAYLTGLQESATTTGEKSQDVLVLLRCLHERWLELVGGELGNMKHNASMLAHASVQLMGVTLRTWHSALSISSIILAVMLLALLPRFYEVPSQVSPDVSDLVSSSPAPSILTTATQTITIRHVSTKTISIASAETSSVGSSFSLSDHVVGAGESRPVVVQLNEEGNILVKFYGNEGIRLATAGIVAHVVRNDIVVQSELSAAPGGIVVEIPNREKHGAVNVTIFTTRKPDFNETFAVDFGLSFRHLIGDTSALLQNVVQKLGKTANQAIKQFEDYCAPALASAEEQVKDTATSWCDSIKAAFWTPGNRHASHGDKATEPSNHVHGLPIENWFSGHTNSIDNAAQIWAEMLRGARKAGQDKMVKMMDAGKVAQVYSQHKAGQTLSWIKTSIYPNNPALTLKSVQQLVNHRLRHVEDFRDGSKLAILKAQVASRLWWLKVQGKSNEHEEYERRARNFMAEKHTEAIEAKKMRDAQAAKAKCLQTGSSNCRCNEKGLGRWKV